MPFAMTTKANAMPKRLRFGMAEPTSHAPANDKPTSYFLIHQRHEVPTSRLEATEGSDLIAHSSSIPALYFILSILAADSSMRLR